MDDLSNVYQWVQQKVFPWRWEHTLSVVDCALRLARVHGFEAAEQRVRLAAVLHDCAKDLPLAAQLNLFRGSGILLTDSDLMCPQVLHGPAGAILVQKELTIGDPGVLRAIAWHTTGAHRLGKLEGLIFLADFVSEDRCFPGVEKLRHLAFRDWKQAVIAGTDKIMDHLLEEGVFLHPRVVWARNDMLARLRGGIRKGRGKENG